MIDRCISLDNKYVLIIFSLLLVACQDRSPTNTPAASATSPQPSLTPTSSPLTPIAFPTGLNPLTGQVAVEPDLLEIPAVLVSISHFPATGRPQAGLSFAPVVYEIYITEGATRFLAVFYGEFPKPELPLTGNCKAREGGFSRTRNLLGGQVWLDLNGNGLQDTGESGSGGVCINLYDSNGNLLLQTTTDSNGYYGFDLEQGLYTLEFIKPEWASFTHTNLGSPLIPVAENEDFDDSDVDQISGHVDVQLSSDILSLDAGLIDSVGALSDQDPAYLPAAQIGPIRSGRLVYGYLADSHPHSCLVYAGASAEVLAKIPQCYLVYHQLAGGGYMLDIAEMRKIAKQNLHDKGANFNYASNIFSESPPTGGSKASRLEVFIAYLNQSAWLFDPLYQSYLRYVDTSEYDLAGVLLPDKDRLTGRQLHFENVIVLFAQHDVVSPTNLDIRLNPGRVGKAILFRDGYMFNIQWSTQTLEGDDPQPIAFQDSDGHPMPLKPGHSWILVVTKESTIAETSPGEWQLLFTPPEGAK